MHTSHVYLIFNVLLYVQRNIIFITFKRDGRKNATIQKTNPSSKHNKSSPRWTLSHSNNTDVSQFKSIFLLLFIIHNSTTASQHASFKQHVAMTTVAVLYYFSGPFYLRVQKNAQILISYSKPELHHYSELVDQLISTALCYISPAV